MKKVILTLVAIVCFACLAVGLVACNLGDDGMDNLTEKEKYAKVLNAFIEYFVPEQSASPQPTAKRKGTTSADTQITVDDVLTKTLRPSSYDGAQRLSLPLTYCYFLKKLCENDKFVIGDKPVQFVATESPGYPMTCIVQFSYDEATGKLTLYLLNTSAQLMGGVDSLMYCEIYYDEQSDSVKDFTLHGNKVGSSENASGIIYYEYITIQKKGNELKEGDTYYYPANGDCLLQGVAQENSANYGEYHVNLLDGILNDFLQTAQGKDVLTHDFGDEMRKTSLFARDLIERLLNSGNTDGEVTEEQWNQAFDTSAFTNFTANWTIATGAELCLKVDNDVFYYVDKDNNAFYYSKENESFYKYQKETNSDDFEKISINRTDYEDIFADLTPILFSSELKDQFSSFKYDKTNNYYYGEDIDIHDHLYTTMVTFENGKVKSVNLSISDQNMVINFTYGDTTVTLPTIIPIERIEFDKTQLTINVDETATLNISIYPENATNTKIRFESDGIIVMPLPAGYLKFSRSIKGLKAGTATVTATTSNGKTATCEVTVTNCLTESEWKYTLNNLQRTRFQSTMTTTYDRNMYQMDASSSVVSGISKKSFSFYDGHQMDIYSRDEDVFYKFTRIAGEEKYLRTALTEDEFYEHFFSFEAMWAFKFVNDYSNFTYDIATHSYVGNDISINGSIYKVSLKFNKQLLIRAEFTLDESHKKVVEYKYEVHDVYPPTDFIDGGGSQEISYDVNNEEWTNALNVVNAQNFTAIMSVTDDTTTYVLNADLKNNRYEFNNNNDEHIVYAKVGDVYYSYTRLEKETTYVKRQTTETSFNNQLASLEHMSVSMLISHYNDFVYDDVEKAYVGNNVQVGDYAYNVILKFENKKLVFADFELSKDIHLIVTYSYGNVTVKLPADYVDGSGGGDIEDIPIENIYFSEKETSMLVGENIQIPLSIEPMDATDKTILWESSNNQIVSVDEEGNLQSLAVGTVTITATTKNGLSATITLRVVNMPDDEKDEPISITLNETHLQMRVNDTFDLDANILPITASTANVKWSSNNSNIAWVDERGVVTALEEGSTTIMATTDNGLTAECTITISGINDDQQEIPVENIVIAPEQPNMYVGETITLTATVYPENATNKNFQWSADSPAVELTDNLDGTCTIRAMAEGAVNVFAIANNGAGTPCLITIISVANLITLDMTYLDMAVGETATVNAIVNGNIEANIQWLTSSDFVTCVDSTATSCTIRALEAGDTTIIAIHHDNNGFSTEIGTINIHVNPSMMTFAGKMYNCYDIASTDISAEDLDILRPQMVNDFLIYFKSDIEAEIDQKSGFGHMECTYIIDGNIIRFTVTSCMTGGEPNTGMEGTTLEFFINGDELSYSNYVEGKGIVTYLLRLQN